MPFNITTGFEFNVAGGPSLKLAQAIPVDAYDFIDVLIADGAADLEVEVQPSSVAGQVRFLLVSASQYEPNLTYRVNAPANPEHALDRPLMLAGAGAVGLLGFAPLILLFSNASGSDINVQVVVGRDATP